MPGFGWQPVVYHPKNPAIPYQDPSLEKNIPPEAEVLSSAIEGPSEWLGRLLSGGGKKNTEALAPPSKKERVRIKDNSPLVQWLKGWAYNPDYNIFWVAPSIRYLTQYLRDRPVDVMITSGPPHSMHLIGLGLKKAFPAIPWIADFRDPWVEMDSLKRRLNNNRFLISRHRKYEKKVLAAVDYLLATGPSMIQSLPFSDRSRYKVITNGFDPADFQQTRNKEPEATFTLFHAGRLNEMRNPDHLWEVMAGLIREEPFFQKHFRLKLAGDVSPGILKQLEDALGSHLQYIGYIPHAELTQHLADASALLLLANQSPLTNPCIPGKLFEYFAVQSAILALSPPAADVRTLVEQYPAGFWSGYTDKATLKKQLVEIVSAPEPDRKAIAAYISRFERRQLTRELCDYLDDVTGQQHG